MPRGIPKDQRKCAECGRGLRNGWSPDTCARCLNGGGKRDQSSPPNEDSETFDAISCITALGLDYLVGSATRFLLESKDGDELENLRTARVYLERAIAAREVA